MFMYAGLYMVRTLSAAQCCPHDSVRSRVFIMTGRSVVIYMILILPIDFKEIILI